jgi:hypothetical protein
MVTLDYGYPWRAGTITCTCETKRVTSTDATTGHFFHLECDVYSLG